MIVHIMYTLIITLSTLCVSITFVVRWTQAVFEPENVSCASTG